MPTEESLSGVQVVSEAERENFVEAVRNGKLSPDPTQVAYHFAGKLDQDVVDFILEASSDLVEAVSTLAGMSFAADGNTAATTATKDSKAASTDKDAQAGKARGNRGRQAMTLEGMQAHTGLTVLTPRSSDGGARAACVGEEAGGGSGGGGSTDAELENVALFISSYAEEREAAAKAAGMAVKPPASPFPVPRGTVVPPNSKLQGVIINTAAKTVQMPGFEAYMKIQHGKDNFFRFLKTDHALHSYYLLAKRHAQMKGANAKGSCAPPLSKSPKTEDPDVLKIMQMFGGVGP